ncbi:MAG TPA: hypothetical protein VNY05_25015 [Candidatus Acidoferrales bacterium]|jgi:hypothetical protein|nr:hypothetical protein [Candidatus Acidoferrales bacterium]
MKLLSAVFAVVTVLSASDPKVAEPRLVARPSVSGRSGVPKGAVETEPGTFRYTDAQGKKWIYRQTPFGVARLQDVPVKRDAVPQAGPDNKPAPAPDLSAGTKATASGDTIRFERPGPFGVYRWEKNKADLDEMEQAAWDRQLARSPAKQD